MINNSIIYSENLRYFFYILLLITILNIDDLSFIDKFYKLTNKDQSKSIKDDYEGFQIREKEKQMY